MLFKKNIFGKFGLSISLVRQFRKQKGKNLRSFKFRGVNIQISNPFWFLHSVEEIFIDEVYKFDSTRAKPLIIDCGANWGLSIIYFKSLYPAAKIFAFEPDPDIFKMLTNNIKNHHFNDISLLNKAIWIDDAEMTFSCEGGVGGTFSHFTTYDLPKVSVQTTRLKDILQLHAIIDFLKIDIEGAEYEVIKDCQYSLANVQNMFIEYHGSFGKPQYLHEILEIISNSGFRYYLKEAWEIMRNPFFDKLYSDYDLQINIFCYRLAHVT
jgi:FkbM family methyltransferase